MDYRRKAFAIAENKRVLIFVEEGVEDIGGIQGDLEYIRFSRDNFASALIKAVDYILAITAVRLETRVEGNNIHIKLGNAKTPDEQLAELRKLKEKRPQDLSIRTSLAVTLDSLGDPHAALREYEEARAIFPNNPDLHHYLAHQYEKIGDMNHALFHFEKSLDLNSVNPKFYRCLAKCLYEKSKNYQKPTSKRPVLEKAKRLLEQGLVISNDPNLQQQIKGDLFLVAEALSELKAGRRSSDE
jgi:tetratricopeptide (TPR) repeat protein